MKPALHAAFFSIVALAAACGGNVVVDQPGDGAGGTTSTTTTSASSSSSTTSGAMGGCTAPLDAEIVNNKPLWPILVNCGMANVGNDPGQLMCILAQTGLSEACATCSNAYLNCNIMLCLTPCLGDPGGAKCLACREQQCDPGFFTCSGLGVHPGPP